MIARELKNYKTIGIDLVAMSVNDIIVQGAKPLFFLDYIAVEKIKKNQILDIIKGISKGCIESDCSLVGGETAELPGLYNDSKFDLAGRVYSGVPAPTNMLVPPHYYESDDILVIGQDGAKA